MTRLKEKKTLLNPTQFCNKVRGSSETIRAACIEKALNVNLYSRNRYKNRKNETLFPYWIAGLIDADGSLLVSPTGYCSCEITVGEKERQVLALVKSKVGGSIKKRSGVKAFRWRLHNTPGMKNLVNLINGKILLSARKAQLEKVCLQLGILPKESEKCKSDNAWLAGFFEGEGYFHLNKKSYQLSITMSQKDQALLQEIASSFTFMCDQSSSHSKTDFLNCKKSCADNAKHCITLPQLQSQTVSQNDEDLFESRFPLTCKAKKAHPIKFCKTIVTESIFNEKKEQERVGSIFYDKSWNGWLYAASSVSDIAIWISYFSKFPLISWKQIQLQRFKKLLLYKSRKVHLKKEGKAYLRFKRLVSEF